MRPLRWLLLGGLVLGLAGACAGKSQDAEGVGGSENTPPPGGASGSGAGAGGNAGSAGAAGTGSTAAGGTSTSTDDDPPPVASRVPEKHRALGEQCDDERAPGNGTPYFDQTSATCTTDSDCEEPNFNCGPDCRTTCFEFEGVKRCAWSRGECAYDGECTAGQNGRCGNNRENWTCSYDECFNDSECTSGGPCACGGRYGPEGPNTCMDGNCRIDADCGAGGYCSPTLGDCGDYSGIIGYYCRTPRDTCVNDSECVDPERGEGYCMYRPELAHWQCGYGQCVG